MISKPKIIKFKDYPEFRPNLSPKQIFERGAFGGTYWRPIHSTVTGKNYKNAHKKFPKSWWGKQEVTLPFDEYDKSLNMYGVKVGTTLEFWEDKGWITKYDPYGWIQWYCNFYQGRRTPDDKRQIDRWLGIAGDKGRFKKRLINMIKADKTKYNDYNISPKIRQTLLHWGYEITSYDIKK